MILENDKPVPEFRAERLYPFAFMEIGQSFQMDKRCHAPLRSSASRYKAQHPGWNYVTRKEGEFIRLWRIA
jgi:hypothetical protein